MNRTGLNELLSQSIRNDDWTREFAGYAGRFEDYRDRLPSVPLAYTRSLLFNGGEYEIVAMRWSPGSISPIHDHGDSRCWVVMLEGELNVENFDRSDEGDGTPAAIQSAGENVLRLGMLDHRLNRRELHRVRNLSNAAAYSLQLYAAPIEQYSIFDALTGRARTVPAIYDSTISLV